MSAPRDPVLGLTVKLPTWCRACGCTLATIGAGKGPYIAALFCSECSTFRGWVSHEAHRFLSEITKNFGPPIEPILIRPGTRTSTASMARGAAGGDSKRYHHPSAKGKAKWALI
jgi:hypothetical protein